VLARLQKRRGRVQPARARALYARAGQGPLSVRRAGFARGAAARRAVLLLARVSASGGVVVRGARGHGALSLLLLSARRRSAVLALPRHHARGDARLRAKRADASRPR